MRLAERCYRALLRLYPAAYRQQYGELMAQLFRDQYRAARRQPRIWGPARLWFHILIDFVISLIWEYRDREKQEIMFEPTDRRMNPGTALILLVPGLATLGLFLFPAVLHGEWIPYFVAALIGAVGYMLARLGLMRRLDIWGGYPAGLLLFFLVFLLIHIWSPALNLGIEPLRSPPMLRLRPALYLIFSLGTFGFVLYLARRRGFVPFLLTVLVLALNLLVWMARTKRPQDPITVWYITEMLAYSVIVLFVVVVGMRLKGLASLVAVTAGLGLQLIWYTVDEYQGLDLTLMILLGAFVPLVICPAWLYLTREWRIRKYGLLVIWTLTLLGMGIVSFLTWRSRGNLLPVLDFILPNLAYYLPVWMGLWLALTIFERPSAPVSLPASPAVQRA